MERLEGVDLWETLHQMLNVRKEDPNYYDFNQEEFTMHVVRELLRGLDFLHSHNFIHKDIKLENIVMHKNSSRTNPMNDTVVMIDFDTVEPFHGPDVPKIEDILGTDNYIAPEAYFGKYSPQSDLFSVGVVAYKMMTGAFPFPDTLFDDRPGENFVGHPKMAEIGNKVAKHKINWKCANLHKHKEAQDLIQKMLHRNPDKRITVQGALKHPWMQRSIAMEHVLSPKHSVRRKSLNYIAKPSGAILHSSSSNSY